MTRNTKLRMTHTDRETLDGVLDLDRVRCGFGELV